ncbi:MAG: hypothetical protein MUF68_00070 [Cyclobacteriaceae bacterium]|nr:hypothetical protein [Cyclobacteriaceae bacterium]
MKRFILFVALVGITWSCDESSEPVKEVPVKTGWFISFENSLLDFEDVDSVFVTIANNVGEVKYKATKEENTFILEENVFDAGAYTVTTEIFAKDIYGARGYYQLQKEITITTEKNYQLPAPTKTSKSEWRIDKSTRLVDENITLEVSGNALSPNFKIEFGEGIEVDYIYHDRTAYRIISPESTAVIDGDFWLCESECPIENQVIYNTDAFLNFTNTLSSNTQWNYVDYLFTVLLKGESTEHTAFIRIER